MASDGIRSQMNQLDLSDTDTEDLFASPSRAEQKKTHESKIPTSEPPKFAASSQTNATPSESRYDTEEAREAALRKELASIKNINQVVEGVVDSLEKAKGNVDVRSCSPISMYASRKVLSLTHASSHYLARYQTHAPSSKPGPASYLRLNTTNASYSILPGMAQRKTWRTWKMRLY